MSAETGTMAAVAAKMTNTTAIDVAAKMTKIGVYTIVVDANEVVEIAVHLVLVKKVSTTAASLDRIVPDSVRIRRRLRHLGCLFSIVGRRVAKLLFST